MNNRIQKPIHLLLLLMLITLIIAGGWGVILLISIVAQGDLKASATGWVHMHGIMLLWGWMGLALFGLANHMLRASMGKAGMGILNIIATAAFIFGMISFLFTTFGGTNMLTFAAGCLLVSAICFSLNLLMCVVSARHGLDLSHLFTLAGAQWLVIWASTMLFAYIRFAGAPILPDYIRNLLLTLSIFGFIGNLFFGLGLRALPGLLKIQNIKIRAGLLALVAYNAGVIFYAGSIKVGHVAALTGALTLLAGTVLYLAMLNFLRGSRSENLSPDARRHNRVIRIAFLFFVATLLMLIGQEIYAWIAGESHRAYVSALRHLLTVGFIAILTVGVGQRLIPLFLRTSLATPRLSLAASLLLVGGCIWRVIAELCTMAGERWIFYVMGPSGIFELAGLLLFALLILRAVMASRSIYRQGDQVTASTSLSQLLAQRPEAAARLTAANLTIPDGKILHQTPISLGLLALSQGAEIEPILLSLNQRETPEKR